jgi:WGR domain
MAFLTRTDTASNIDRFYLARIEPHLFGTWPVLREWGRPARPAPCASAATSHVMKPAGKRHVKRRLAHGLYRS